MHTLSSPSTAQISSIFSTSSAVSHMMHTKMLRSASSRYSYRGTRPSASRKPIAMSKQGFITRLDAGQRKEKLDLLAVARDLRHVTPLKIAGSCGRRRLRLIERCGAMQSSRVAAIGDDCTNFVGSANLRDNYAICACIENLLDPHAPWLGDPWRGWVPDVWTLHTVIHKPIRQSLEVEQEQARGREVERQTTR